MFGFQHRPKKKGLLYLYQTNFYGYQNCSIKSIFKDFYMYFLRKIIGINIYGMAKAKQILFFVSQLLSLEKTSLALVSQSGSASLVSTCINIFLFLNFNVHTFSLFSIIFNLIVFCIYLIIIDIYNLNRRPLVYQLMCYPLKIKLLLTY